MVANYNYLNEIIKEAKKENTNIEQKMDNIIQNKPEEKEEELARTIKKEEMQKIEDIEEDPSTEKNETEKELDQEKKIELASYGKVKIYKIPGKPLNYYYVPTTRPTAVERKIINTLKEATTRLVSSATYKIRNQDEKRIIYKQKIIEIIQNNPNLRIPESKTLFYAEAVVREMVGYGLIDDLIKDDNLEEIMIIGSKKPVFVFHRQYEMMQTNIEFYSEQEIEDLINRIAREIGRRVDVASPLLDARLADGSRVNATIPPASISGGTLTIRKFRDDPYSIIDLIKLNTISSEVAAFLWMCVEGLNTKPANILIAGGTGSGKTTLLNVMAALIPDRERIITIEDTAEINIPTNHWIRLEARPPGIEGTGELKLDVLTKNSLRMRPDRILVGEIRHEEAFTLFTAINTGHDGCLGTVHANSPQETIVRVTSPPMNVPEIMLSGLDLIIVEHRYYDRRKGTIRRVSEISEVYGALEGKAKTQTIYQRDPARDVIEKTIIESQYIKNLQNYTGLSREQIMAEQEIRKQFLEKLLERNIREIKQVSTEMKNFLEQRKKFGEQ
ncbi:MAG: CpaF family protein [Candidatus Diapherotrites archaeon]|uniref:CpaF family protein n=1 Tax=Candidatus Iainarchaeum sp. TaxID=3101447 RepID=A0A7K4BZ07_9ARCH|nr:CpaF family protein [Candidatus Diapherotrites archaeon]